MDNLANKLYEMISNKLGPSGARAQRKAAASNAVEKNDEAVEKRKREIEVRRNSVQQQRRTASSTVKWKKTTQGNDT